MKKNIVFALLASAIFLAGLTGCVSQKEHEGVVAQVQALESENTRLKAEALELSAKVDEYENGKENLLVKVRNHFEKKEYDEAKQLAQTLHKKFNGTSEDQQAQQIIQQIDKTLEEQKRTKEAAESKATIKLLTRLISTLFIKSADLHLTCIQILIQLIHRAAFILPV